MKRNDKRPKNAGTLSYFAVLGVGEDVNQEELEARYQELAEYLASDAVPSHVREWAERQAELVDEAYAVLADPERRAAVRRERPPHKRPAEPKPAPTRPERTSDPTSPSLLGGVLSARSRPLVLGGLMGLVVLAAVLVGRYGFPSGEASDTRTEAPEALADLDADHIAELMTALQDSPDDPAILFELGETYFQAGEWQSSIDWFTRLLEVDPQNVHALTDIGTSNYNLGFFDFAEEAWLKALEIDPNDVQAHYNLGFLYANADPQDLAAARREWETVVTLDPGSELAQVAQAHLDGISGEEATDQTQAAE